MTDDPVAEFAVHYRHRPLTCSPSDNDVIILIRRAVLDRGHTAESLADSVAYRVIGYDNAAAVMKHRLRRYANRDQDTARESL